MSHDKIVAAAELAFELLGIPAAENPEVDELGTTHGHPTNWSAIRPPSLKPLRKAPCTVAG